jgi:hypothetical protein
MINLARNFYHCYKPKTMEENNDFMENNDLIPHMKSLSMISNKMVLQGYDDDFKITDEGLKSLKTEKVYQPDQINVINYFRFEGQSDPNDNTILYVIETSDGVKGTVVDAYGAYADRKLAEFMNNVESISKKTAKT